MRGRESERTPGGEAHYAPSLRRWAFAHERERERERSEIKPFCEKLQRPCRDYFGERERMRERGRPVVVGAALFRKFDTLGLINY